MSQKTTPDAYIWGRWRKKIPFPFLPWMWLDESVEIPAEEVKTDLAWLSVFLWKEDEKCNALP